MASYASNWRAALWLEPLQKLPSSFPENAFWMFELWQNIYYDIQTSFFFFSFPPYKILPFISIQFNQISAQKNQLFL